MLTAVGQKLISRTRANQINSLHDYDDFSLRDMQYDIS